MSRNSGHLLRLIVIGCLAAACCSAARGSDDRPLFRWVDIERRSEPVFRTRPGTLEDNWFCPATVIRVNGQLRMYYEASSPKGDWDVRLFVADSKDGIAWERSPRNPIWDKKQGGWTKFIRDVRVFQFGPSDFWLYYSDGDEHIDLARSTDGLNWKNCEQNPILSPSQSWEDHVMQESILKLGNTDWRMWYGTYGTKPRIMGYATSTDGIHWMKYEGNPIFGLGEKGKWDDYSAFQPCVFQQDGYFHMIYTGSKGGGFGYRMGYAWSKDGVHWTKSPQNPFFEGAKGEWDAGKVSCATLLPTGSGTYNIYYAAAPKPTVKYNVGIGLVRARLKKEKEE